MLNQLYLFLHKILFIFLLLSFSVCASFAQTEKTPVKTVSDSTKAIPDTLLFQIEQAQNVINQINTHNKTSYNLVQIQMELPDIKANVAEIKEDIFGTTRIIEIKTLLSYQTILKGDQNQLSDWRKTLSDYNYNLRKMSEQLICFSSDTHLSPVENDSTQKKLYGNQLSNFRSKLQNASKTTAASLDSVGNILAKVSTLYFEVNDLQSGIRERLKAAGQSTLSKESPYLWSAPPITTTTNIGKLFRTSYQGQNRILSYFISGTWDNRLLLILFGTAFFVWVFRNFKVVKTVPINPKLAALKFNYIGPIPILATLIVVLSLTPLFEPNSPPSYVELIQLILLIVLVLFFRRRLKSGQFKFWLLIVALYIVLTVTITVINYGLILRSLLILLNLGSAYIGIIFYKKADSKTIDKKF